MTVERIYTKEISFESVFKDFINKKIETYLQKSSSLCPTKKEEKINDEISDV